MQPAAGHWPSIDLAQRHRVKPQLHQIFVRPLFSFLLLDLVSLEIEDPDFSREDDSQIDGSLQDHELVAGNAIQKRNASMAIGGDTNSKRNFSMNRRSMPQDVRADLRAPETANRRDIEHFDLRSS